MKRVAGLLKYTAVAAAFFVCFTAIPVCYAGAPPAKPEEAVPATGGARMSAVPEEFDFGTIDEGDKPKAVFNIKNTGTEKLVIYDAKPSCGCTLANLSSKEIEPGGEATLEAVFNSHNAHGGPVSKYVTVKTNDPTNPSRILRIKGTVKAKPAPLLTLNPYRADNLRLKPGATEHRLIKLSNTGELDLTISEVTASPGASAKLDEYVIAPGNTVKMQLLLKPGEVRTVEVDIKPAPKPGQFQEVVTFRSNSKRMQATVFVAKGIVE